MAAIVKLIGKGRKVIGERVLEEDCEEIVEGGLTFVKVRPGIYLNASAELPLPLPRPIPAQATPEEKPRFRLWPWGKK